MDEIASQSEPLAAENDLVFRALADAHRQRIVQLLLREELNVTELVEIMAQPQSTISRHLRALRDAGLVADRRDGTAIWYSIPRLEKTNGTSKKQSGASVKASRATSHRLVAKSESRTKNNGFAGPRESRDSLQEVVLQWLDGMDLPEQLEERLNRVIRQRKGGDNGFFNRLGRKWDELRTAAFGDSFALEAMISLLPREWTVADIGSGTGYLLPILGRHFRSVAAVEPAEAMLACARHRITEAGLSNVTFHQGDLTALPMKTASCDLALAILVLHHVSDPAAALAEMHRICRPDAQILIVEQAAHRNQEFHDKMQDRWWGFEPKELANQLSHAGFSGVRFHQLMTPDMVPNRKEAPSLFALTGKRRPTK